MIGLIATVLAGILLKNYTLFLITLPYMLRLKSRNASLAIFYLYTLLIATSLPNTPIYTSEGLKLAMFVTSSTVLALDDILRGIKIEQKELTLSLLMIVSAVTDYTFIMILTAVVIYSFYEHFGKTVAYLIGWIGILSGVMYLEKNHITDPGAQAFIIIGLGLLFILFAERKDVEFLEVNLFERE